MNNKGTDKKGFLEEEKDIVRCIETLKREAQGRATEEAMAYQLALLLDVRNLLAKLSRDFEQSLVA